MEPLGDPERVGYDAAIEQKIEGKQMLLKFVAIGQDGSVKQKACGEGHGRMELKQYGGTRIGDAQTEQQRNRDIQEQQRCQDP